jgi:hypothetical protein
MFWNDLSFFFDTVEWEELKKLSLFFGFKNLQECREKLVSLNKFPNNLLV